ncbi:hypothetical protein CTI12_AA311410 [Artemisia annua]|uniref:Uncharacterized protein n=1 Tax=Artemisia annua TaxID=35608 RepID=A0A2U1N435_ARTAN|nr:hypothetical protein CTI12_AA311410 [Artemisia annua]
MLREYIPRLNLVLDRVNELKSETLGEKTSTSSPMCTPHMSASTKDKDKIRDPATVNGKGHPAGGIKSTFEKIITRKRRRNYKIMIILELRVMKKRINVLRKRKRY